MRTSRFTQGTLRLHLWRAGRFAVGFVNVYGELHPLQGIIEAHHDVLQACR